MQTTRSSATTKATETETDIVITRVFDAPRGQVWKAWTEPERMKRWWGPHGFTTPVCTIDLRKNGVIHCCMRSPDGQDFWNKGVLREIVEPKRLAYTDSFSDEQGNVVSAVAYGMSPDWPLEALVTVTFDEQRGGKTKLTLRHAVTSAPAKERADCTQGWTQLLDRLAEELAKA